MNARGLTVAVVAAGWLATSAGAQTPQPEKAATGYVDPVAGVTLEQAIDRALAQSPALRAARSQIDAARGMRVQAGLRPNPSVSFERREEPAGTDAQTMVAVEWPLELFGRRSRLAVADREVAAADLAVADRERLLASEVRAAYGEVLVATRDLSLLDRLVAATAQQHQLLRSRVEQGASPPLDRDLVEVELRRLESDRLLQAGRTEAAMLELKRLLGMPPGETLTVRQPLEDFITLQLSTSASAQAADPDQRADVREAAARIAVAEARIGRARDAGRLGVSLFGNYTRMDAGFPQRGFAEDGGIERIRGRFHYVSAGAMVSIPLLNRNQGEVAAARAERAGAQAAYEAVRLAVEAEVAAARAKDARAGQAARLFGDAAQSLARQNLAVVQQSYELGRVTVFDVLAEQRRYLDVERWYTEALRSAYEARTALKRALGDLR